MMPNPFTPPPEGAPENVQGAWRHLVQKVTNEQSARAYLEKAESETFLTMELYLQAVHEYMRTTEDQRTLQACTTEN